MTDADVVLPLCANDSHCHILAMVAMRTLRASTDARVIVLCNNTPNESRRNAVREECGILGLDFHYMDGPFSISKAFNYGASIGTRKYIAYATQDVIFFPGWLDNIISLWEENPHYFCLCNYSFDLANNPCTKHDTASDRRIVDTHNPSSGVTVLKRENGYKWDEQFTLWEIDADFLYYIETHNLKAGYCLNARCDHIVDGIKPHINMVENFGQDVHEFYSGSKDKVRRKWGATYKG